MTNGYTITRWRCCDSASIKSWLAIELSRLGLLKLALNLLKATAHGEVRERAAYWVHEREAIGTAKGLRCVR